MGFVGKKPSRVALSTDDITDGAIVNADINASAAIAMSKTAFSAGNGVTLSTNTLNVDAAQTTITSLLATNIKIGEDNETKIDFEDDNKINFYANNAKEVELAENSLSPGSSDGTALGTTSLMWADLFLASGGVVNFNNGDVTLTHSANTLTVAGGTLATAALTSSTITASGIIKTDDTTDATSTTDGSLQTDGGLSVVKDAVIGDDLLLLSDSAVLKFGADSDTTLTHTDGTGITLNSTNKLTFGDAATFIHQSSDGVMTIDGEATIDLNASTAVLVSNDLKLDSDSAILSLGAGDDATFTHDGTTGLTIAATPISIDSTGELHLNSTTGDIKLQDGGTDQITFDLDGTAGEVIMKPAVDSDDLVISQYDGTEVIRIEDNASLGLVGNKLSIANSSSDVIIKPLTDAKDIIFQQYDGTEVARIEDNATFNVSSAGKFAYAGTAVTATAAELNLLDGGTSVGGSITLADADGVVVNDGGTMKTIPASDIKTYASGGGTFDAVAGGAISAGDLVGIQADGKVKTLAAGDHNDASSDAPPNTQSQLLGDVGAAVAGISISYNPDTSKALLMWSEGNSEWSLNGAMVTINTTTGALTVGSAVEFFSGDNGSGSDGYPHWNAGLYPTATYDTNVDRYFVTYGMNGNAYNHTGLKGFVCYNNTGTSISSGSHSFIREHGYVYGAGNYYVTAMGAENKMAVTYFHRAWGSGGSEDTSTSGNRGYHTHLITVAASSFTITLSYKHMNTHVEGNSGITWDEGVDSLVQTFNGSDGDAHVRVGQWDSSAGEITFGTATEYNTVVGSSDGSGHFAMPYYWAAAGKVAIVQSVTSTTDASDTAQGLYLILATVTGGSTNTVAVSSNRTLLYNARLSSTEVCIYEFTAGNLDDKLIVTWKRGYTSNEAGWQIFDYVASGVTVSSFYGPVQMDDILDTYYHAPQVLSRGQGLSLLVIPDDDNDDIDYITPSMATQTSDAAHYTRWCGIANAAISSGATGTITSVGGVGTGQSSLTAGTWYQINSSGALAALTNSYTDNDYATVGFATSATTIYITGAFSN